MVGERLTLAGTAFVALARQRVVAASIVITNDTRTQTYVESADYLVSALGTETTNDGPTEKPSALAAGEVISNAARRKSRLMKQLVALESKSS